MPMMLLSAQTSPSWTLKARTEGAWHLSAVCCYSLQQDVPLSHCSTSTSEYCTELYSVTTPLSISIPPPRCSLRPLTTISALQGMPPDENCCKSLASKPLIFNKAGLFCQGQWEQRAPTLSGSAASLRMGLNKISANPFTKRSTDFQWWGHST